MHVKGKSYYVNFVVVVVVAGYFGFFGCCFGFFVLYR